MKKKTQEQFLEDCYKVHGDKYDYSLVEYNGAHTKVKILCNEHGIFEQTPDAHINGRKGCKLCANSNSGERQKIYISPTLAEKKLNAVHNSKYSYRISGEITYKDYIIAVCEYHGEFKQRYDHHLNGSGCKNASMLS